MTESALAAVGHRLRGADLAPVAGELPAAIALIARVCPQVRSDLVAATIAEAFAKGSAGKAPDGAGDSAEGTGAF